MEEKPKSSLYTNNEKCASVPSSKFSQHVSLFIGVTINVISVVGIIVLNKRIQIHHGYPFVVFLSATHFTVTSIALRIMLRLRIFDFKPIPLKLVLLKGALDSASTTFMNINLSHNSVGTYQISKLCLIPVTVIMQFIFWRERISLATIQVLSVLCFAIGVATVTDINITGYGLFWAVAAILVTVYSQILTTLYLRNLGCNAMQLLLHTSPWISGYMLLMVPVLDNVTSITDPIYRATSPGIAADVALSCVLAVGVNVTNYLVLGKTSPLTYQASPPPPATRIPRRIPPARTGNRSPVREGRAGQAACVHGWVGWGSRGKG